MTEEAVLYIELLKKNVEDKKDKNCMQNQPSLISQHFVLVEG